MAEQSAENNKDIAGSGETNGGDTEAGETTDGLPYQRPPLLETPAEYDPQTNWDCQDWSQQMSAMSWQNNRGGLTGGPHGVPPPPRPPYGMQFPYGGVAGNDNNPFAVPSGSPARGGFAPGTIGRGRGAWDGSPQNQFRNFPRPPRGGGMGGGSPFFNRGRGNRGAGSPMMMRGSPGQGFRGKFRGKNNWI